mmetsp:Transcript_93832/g.148214  ORF Transcript_93832/g.148214 Transcript_93832/m.148214 type:complete len:371 (-) Transcript_93832:65-1177(-)|eukprot:CAMPEP_0169372258 /NCGR_PEP_ID=MMETSP1017-20121227/36360_1 /TAXON_ID=342587 /ORGANISM="Karlodinium micrum, Strain CCMP2283" /LENGTH=370 /DNA_ID=CAMNT_0009470861 /DNA_START=33 /DNA_END=1145 /DNA_ORIENTATION=+
MAKPVTIPSAVLHKREYWLPYQEDFDKFYNSLQVQVGVAVLIGANFLTNIVEKEIDPSGKKYETAFDVFEYVYNVLFTVELIINMYAHWFWLFWKSGWNIFDVIVVTIGLVTMSNLPLPSGFSLLRMMRAFRVFRLFKRVKSLNKIIVSIVKAVPGMMNAFLILTIILSIFAILGVEFYDSVGKQCKVPQSLDAWHLSARGHCWGYEYFGSFSKAAYSFFQTMTGESWSEAVSRPSMWSFDEQWYKSVGGGIFYVVFMFITAFVMTNVVVAVLLEKMVDPDTENAAQIADTPSPEEGTDSVPFDQRIHNMDDLNSAMESLQNEIDELMADSDGISSSMGTLTADVTSVREQLSSLHVGGCGSRMVAESSI